MWWVRAAGDFPATSGTDHSQSIPFFERTLNVLCPPISTKEVPTVTKLDPSTKEGALPEIFG